MADWYQPSKELKIHKCNTFTVFDQMTLIKRPEKKRVWVDLSNEKYIKKLQKATDIGLKTCFYT